MVSFRTVVEFISNVLLAGNTKRVTECGGRIGDYMLVDGSTAIPAMSRSIEILLRKRISRKDNDGDGIYIVRENTNA